MEVIGTRRIHRPEVVFLIFRCNPHVLSFGAKSHHFPSKEHVSMANTQVGPGLVAILGYAGEDAGGNPLPLSSLTATVDDYTDAYISPIGTAQVILVQKTSQPQGSTKTVNVTFNGISQDGTHLTPTVVAFDLVGPTPPPQATQVAVSLVAVRDTVGLTVPPDPGSATVTLI